MKRKKLAKSYSKKVFRKTAQNVHPKNAPNYRIMRGGIRL